MNTVYRRDTIEETKQIISSSNRQTLIEALEAFNKDRLDFPRSKEDFLKSIILGRTLSLYTKSEANEIEAFNEDLKIPEVYQKVKYIFAFDTETTSFSGYACSIAFILYNLEENKVEKQFYTLLNPLVPITRESYEVHGISDEDVKGEKTFKDIVEEFEESLNVGDLAVGHNITFDFKVLDREYERIGRTSPLINYPLFDTMKYGRNIMNLKDINGKKTKDPNLEEAMNFYGLEKEGSYHNALTDTMATLEIFKKMVGVLPL